MNPVLRALVTLSLGLGALSASGAWAEPRLSQQSELEADARGLRGLAVENARGSVHVQPSADGRIHVRALKLSKAARMEDARRLADEISVQSGPEGDRYRVRVNYPTRMDVNLDFWDMFRSHDGPLVPKAEVRLVIEAPPSLALSLASVSGDLTTERVTAAQTLRSTSGDVRVAAAGGAVDAHTISGNLDVEGATRLKAGSVSGDLAVHGVGPLRASTTSGDVVVEGARDSVWLRSTSGDLTVEDAPHGVDAQTSSGDIKVRDGCGRFRLSSMSGSVLACVRRPLSAVTLSSTSGGVVLRVPEGLDASLDLSTGSGDLSCDVPVTLLEHHRNRMRASLGRGGPAIQLSTASGDVHVTRGER